MSDPIIVPVMNNLTQQVENRDITNNPLGDVQNVPVVSTLPESFKYLATVPAANNMESFVGVPQDLVVAGAIDAVDEARSELVSMFNIRVDALESSEGMLGQAVADLQAHDIVLDQHDVALAAHDTELDNLVANKVDKVSGKGLSTNDYTTAEKTKLSGIATGATANQTDAYLLNRTNHTGTQAVSTITGLATVATTGNYNDLANQPTIPSIPTRAYATPARPLNTSFQVSTTRDAFVSYAVDIACTSALIAGQSGSVFLEYADNSAISTNVVNPCTSTQSSGGVLNIATIGTANVVGNIPAGKWVRIRTVNNTGTPTFTFRSSQETLL